jgi:hypothetical protein
MVNAEDWVNDRVAENKELTGYPRDKVKICELEKRKLVENSDVESSKWEAEKIKV